MFLLIGATEEFSDPNISLSDTKLFQGLHLIKSKLSVKTVLENIFYRLRNSDSTISHDYSNNSIIRTGLSPVALIMIK